MPRLKLTLQYKGTSYQGWQVQPSGPTIQAVLEEKLAGIFHQKINTIVSGRTDSGVHAAMQVVHFDVPVFSMMPENLMMGLNSVLPEDISVQKVQIVSAKFHAQKSVKRKFYEYTIFNSHIPSPFLEEYSWRVPYKLNLAAMRKAAKVLVGRHDFKSFCASDSTAKTTVRRISSIKVTPWLDHGVQKLWIPRSSRGMTTRLITITITGPGFLKHMVRNIVGTLVDVGRGKITGEDVKKILKAKDRRTAGMTAPAKGLMLKKVVY